MVTVSSDSHYGARLNWDDLQLRRHYNGLRAYGNTKLANVLFTLELNRRLGAQSTVRAFAADPGLVKTDIGLKGTPAMVRWVWELAPVGGHLPGGSRQGIVFLLTEPALQSEAHPTGSTATPSAPAGKRWIVSPPASCGSSRSRCAGSPRRCSMQPLEKHPARTSLVAITGAAGGLGKAFAVECASRGWDLFLTDLPGEPLETLAAGLRSTYGVP